MTIFHCISEGHCPSSYNIYVITQKVLINFNHIYIYKTLDNRLYRIKMPIQVPVFWCIYVYLRVFMGNCRVFVISIQVF